MGSRKFLFDPIRNLRDFLGVFICLLTQPTWGQQSHYQFSLPDIALHDPVHTKWIRPPGSAGKGYLQIQADTFPMYVALPGKPDGYAWDKARYLVMEVEHENAFATILYLSFYEASVPDRSRVRFKTGILPGIRTQVIFPLSYLSAQSIYTPRYPRQLKGSLEGNAMLPESVGRVLISLQPVQEGIFMPAIRIYNVHLSDEMPQALPPPAAPLVDSTGQWAGRTWPGKTRSVHELNRAIQKQMLESRRPLPPTTRFLGNPRIRFQATGYFRTHHDGKRWWFVDPQGFAFLSSGIDCMRSHSSGPVIGMEDLLSWVPAEDSAYLEQFSAFRNQVQFNFLGANLSRALGRDWKSDWNRFAHHFLVENRFNTIGNWSDPTFCAAARLPWVYPMKGFPETPKPVFRDFPDVFDPAFVDSARRFAQQLEPLKTDSFLIGYFLRNEPEWAFGDHNLAAEMLMNPWTSHSRKALISWLEKEFSYDIRKLNARWEEKFSSFSALDSGAIRVEGAQARKDLMRFTDILVDSMIGIVCREVKKVDPHHLNLGLRYAWISSDLCYRAGSHFDVFSLNGYAANAPSQTGTIARKTGKPVLIGEFHIGTLDRGLPASGIVAAESSEERAWAIRHYIEEAFSRPEVIGVHYFQLYDQPFTGRFDGENYQIGFLDIGNQPYHTVLDQVKQANQNLYSVARKKRKPFYKPVKAIKPIFY